MIHVENLTKVYGAGSLAVRVLDGFSLAVAKGAFCGLVGPSGSGKTTLLNIMGALDRPTSGRVLLDGIELSSPPERELYRVRRDKVGFVFQLYHLLRSLKARENVTVPALPWQRVNGTLRKRAVELLAVVGLDGKENRYPGELSGGEQQRVAIARALILDHPVILADEPTGNLDRESGHKIIGLLRDLNRELGKTVVIATHDPEVARVCQLVVRLGNGKLGQE